MSLVRLAPGFASFERIESSGWSVASYVLVLPSGGTLLHAPVWIDETTADTIEAMGPPEVLFAPNHFHHLSLSRYRARFPRAQIVASDRATPRLVGQRHLARAGHGVGPLSGVVLPSGAALHPLEGTKNGETLLSVPLGGGARGLVVCDALFHVNRPTTGLTGVILRATDTAPGLTIGKTFLWLGVADRAAFAASLRRVLAETRPTKLFFSHGDPYDVGDGARLHEVIAGRFGAE